ncbi:PucR family transcriptional regulator [Jeotgalibacillus sp. S-D1]|uniref:PucR family transcriptional regulator n=1 Tax=Jeotgalibacillus sp. S-D1 TaxID=2552189 RepID=UPI00105975C8|nr:PucR family transcriptional regulator [Jeotgalibacillus sp. S-D1]TDL32710.1 PucR family transcriptional regulator [Jeotgalibacillus sp. S-D1]
MTSYLTVRDVLLRDTFNSARVVAGAGGLHKQVKWSHILEVDEVESLINGGELILSTGVGLRLDLDTQLAYVKRLIEKNTACICFELGAYIQQVPEEIIELANKKDFPIVVFDEIVKFVDITQDLHALITNKHYEILSQLDKLSNKFIELSMAPNGILKILQELHQHFKESALFITNESKPFYYPVSAKEKDSLIRLYLQNTNSNLSAQQMFTVDQHSFAMMPVRGLGQVWGHLCLQTKGEMADEFLFLILDRAALAITQILLRNRTIEERKQNLEDQFVQKVLNGRSYNSENLQLYIPVHRHKLAYRVVIIKTDDMENTGTDWEETRLRRSMMIRLLFKNHGLFPAVSITESEIAVIAAFPSEVMREKDLFKKIIHTLIDMKEVHFPAFSQRTCGISMSYHDIKYASRAYEEAQETFELQSASVTDACFYDDLGIYRLLIQLKKSGQLERYIQDYLTPIMDYDKQMENKLFETLTVFLECGGVVKNSADRLFIVRQTLYNRLELLKTILGEDFMEPQNRLALEVAIKAYKLDQWTGTREKTAE